MHALAVLTLLFALVPSLLPAQQKAPPQGTAEHDAALRRAQVWFEPAVPVDQARLGENPAGPDDETFSPDEEVVCSFKPDFVSGSTPKFDCERPNGKKIKVKYGRDNAEIYAEVVASRLLTALGFPADRMYVVKRVRCFGCPPDPFEGLQCLNEGKPVESCFSNLDYTKSVDFDYAVIERRLKGAELETKRVRGWGWDELTKIDPAAGGASRAQVDALRLLAVFLNHWDNKPKNQRVLCLDEKEPAAGSFLSAAVLWRWCRIWARRSDPTSSISTTGRRRRSGTMRRPAAYQCAHCLTADRAFPTLIFPKRDGSFSRLVSRNSRAASSASCSKARGFRASRRRTRTEKTPISGFAPSKRRCAPSSIARLARQFAERFSSNRRDGLT